jgi:hypothetical protein
MRLPGYMSSESTLLVIVSVDEIALVLYRGSVLNVDCFEGGSGNAVPLQILPKRLLGRLGWD